MGTGTAVCTHCCDTRAHTGVLYSIHTLPRVSQPHGAMRVALVLYGKVGTWALPSSGTNLAGVTDGLEGASSLLRQARRTFESRVVGANPHVHFEAFAHSWSKPSRFNPV